MIGLITLEMKQAGERSAGNPLAAFEVAGTGNVARSRYCGTRRRKGEPTENTNTDLNRLDPVAEPVEERGSIEGNAPQAAAHRTQSRESGSTGLERVREVDPAPDRHDPR